jgi:8-amino-7-oxononanoate synthase
MIDDTQALGILGSAPGQKYPYGSRGGGSLRAAGIGPQGVITVSSLAKAFGAPVAMLGGTARMVRRFRLRSRTRVHCSPPSAAAIAAAGGALAENRRRGDELRARLAMNVAQLRHGMEALGLLASRSLFPVQPLRLAGPSAARVHARLRRSCARAVLHGGSVESARVSFLVTARHTTEEIACGVARLADAVATISYQEERSELWNRI